MAHIRQSPYLTQFALKSDVDRQVEMAYYSKQWPVVVNLARRRFRTTSDEYYKAVEVAALSHLDNPADRTAGREYLEGIVSDKDKTINDPDALILYEIAIDGLGMEFCKTIGLLHVRLVKALPRDRAAGDKSLEICLRHTDWEHAQEIAVLLHKNFPNDRKFLLHMILTYSLVAQSKETTAAKKQIFSNLAKAQVDRLFNLRPEAGKILGPSADTVVEEQDALLWLEIKTKYGSKEENLKLLSLPNWGPLFFLERGLMFAFKTALKLLIRNEHFDELVRIAHIIFDRALTITDASQTDSSSSPSPEDEIAEHYVEALLDHSVLMSLVFAARISTTGSTEMKAFQTKIDALMSLFREQKRMSAIHESNYAKFSLEMIYTRASLGGDDDEPENRTKIQTLVDLTSTYFTQSSNFLSITKYLDLLKSKKEIVTFLSLLEKKGEEKSKDPKSLDRLILVAVGLKVRYWQATSLKDGEVCEMCHNLPAKGPDCVACFQSIATSALEAFKLGVQLAKDKSMESNQDMVELLTSLTMLGTLCLIQLARGPGCHWGRPTGSPLYNMDMQLFMQAVAWATYHTRSLPHRMNLRLYVIKLYIMMGCASEAMRTWDTLDVKNSLWECMATYIIDRLATVCPAYVLPGPSGHSDIVDSILDHFDMALRHRFPESLIEASRAGSYLQFQEAVDNATKQGFNSAMIVAAVESRRAYRLKSGKNETAIDDDVLVGAITLEDMLFDYTDYSIMPNWQGLDSASVTDLLDCGPLPSSRRCHLSLIAERFIDIVCHVVSKDHKPSKAAQIQHADWAGTISTLRPMQERINTLIYGESDDKAKFGDRDLTRPECWYFRLVDTLTRIVLLVLEEVLVATTKSDDAKTAKEKFSELAKFCVKIFEAQTSEFLAVPNGLPTKLQTLHGVANSHAMGMLRESSLVLKHTVHYITAALGAKSKDNKARSGSLDPAWILSELKVLSSAASGADKQIRDRVKLLSENLKTSGWVDRVDEWIFGDNAVLYATNREFRNSIASLLAEVIPQAFREENANDIAESMRHNINGWNNLKLD